MCSNTAFTSSIRCSTTTLNSSFFSFLAAQACCCLVVARKDVRRCLEEQAIALLSASHVLMLHQVQGHHNSPFSISNSDLFSQQPAAPQKYITLVCKSPKIVASPFPLSHFSAEIPPYKLNFPGRKVTIPNRVFSSGSRLVCISFLGVYALDFLEVE